MRTTVLLLAVVAVCHAQGPTPPKFPETFMAKTMVYIKEHGPEEVKGEGEWERNVELKKAKKAVRVMERNTTVENERLELFDKHMTYDIFKNASGEYCRKQELPEKVEIPMVWEWLEKAHCENREDPRTRKMIEECTDATPVGILTVFTDPSKPDVPMALIRRDSTREEDIRFVSFETTAPPAGDFTVPAVCMK